MWPPSMEHTKWVKIDPDVSRKLGKWADAGPIDSEVICVTAWVQTMTPLVDERGELNTRWHRNLKRFRAAVWAAFGAGSLACLVVPPPWNWILLGVGYLGGTALATLYRALDGKITGWRLLHPRRAMRMDRWAPMIKRFEADKPNWWNEGKD